MKWFVVLMLLATGCEDALTQLNKDRRKLQADWWADVRQGANAGCIHPSDDGRSSKCQVAIIHGSVIEFYEILCDENDCYAAEIVKCEASK